MLLSQFNYRIKPASGDTTIIERVTSNTLTNSGTGSVSVVDRGSGDMCLRLTGGTMLLAFPTSLGLVSLTGGSGDLGATFICRVKTSTIDVSVSTTQIAAGVGSAADTSGSFSVARYGSSGQALARCNWIGSVSLDSALSMATEKVIVIRMTPNNAGNSGFDTLDMWITGGSGSGDSPDFTVGSNYSGVTLSHFVANALGTFAYDISDALIYRPTSGANLTDAQCRSVITLGIDAAISADSGDTTAPTLTSPAGTATGSTTATGTVSTNEANGTLYRLASTNATESAATVKAAALTQAVTATGTQSVTFTGLTASTTYYAHYVHRDAAGNDSTVATSASFATSAASDTTPPVLSSPTGTATGSTTASGTVSTNEENGTLYSLASTNSTVSVATVKTGGSQAVSSSGVKTASFVGLLPSTTYYAHYVHTDAAGNDSLRSTSASFTTSAPAAVGTITVPALKNWAGSLLSAQVVENIVVIKLSDRTTVTTFANQITDSIGNLVLTSAALIAGTACMVVGFNATGTARFARALTVA